MGMMLITSKNAFFTASLLWLGNVTLNYQVIQVLYIDCFPSWANCWQCFKIWCLLCLQLVDNVETWVGKLWTCTINFLSVWRDANLGIMSNTNISEYITRVQFCHAWQRLDLKTHYSLLLIIRSLVWNQLEMFEFVSWQRWSEISNLCDH